MHAFDDMPPSGIQVANENENGAGLTGKDITITNNIVVGARNGFMYGAYQQGGGLRNTLIAGNTFVGSSQALFRVDDDTHMNTRIIGNILHQIGDGALAQVPTSTGLTFERNLFFGGEAGSAAGTGDVYADPLLPMPGSYDPDDYRVPASSPAVGKGVALELLSSDFFGASRTSPPDIGAVQH
jgi:hypothetical protein